MKNNEYRKASRQIKNTSNRNSRLKKDAIRSSDDRNIRRYGECPRSFSAYAEMRDLSEASVFQRAGDAAKAAWGAWSGNNTPKKPEHMLSRPEDGHFHDAELDMEAIANLVDKMKTPELKRAVKSLAIKATEWFRDGAPQQGQQKPKPQQQQPQQQVQQKPQQVQPQQQQPQQVQPQQQQPQQRTV